MMDRSIKNWIIPGFEDYNCTGLNISYINGPTASEFLTNLETYQAILLAVAGLLTILSSLLAFVECIYVYNHVRAENRRNKLYFLVTLFPISTVLCLIGMMMPRVSPICTSGGMLYFLLCLFVLISLIRHLKNGRNELSNELMTKEKRINFQSPPLCCFCSCLPEADATQRNLRILEFIVLQAPIVRAIVLFIEAVITVEIQRDASFEIQLCETATFISIVLAIFGVHTMARLVSRELSSTGFMWMFRITDIGLFFFSAQHPFIFQNILLRFNLIGCGVVLTPPEIARFLCNFIIIVELFLLSILGTFTARRGGMFDRAHKKRQETNEIDDNAETESITETIISTTSVQESGREVVVTNEKNEYYTLIKRNADNRRFYGSLDGLQSTLSMQ